MRAHRVLHPAAEAATARAGDPAGWQAAYDAARDLQEAVRRAEPVSRACRPLWVALSRAAAGRVRQMEGIDRPSAADARAGRRAAVRARAAARRAAPACRGTGRGRPQTRLPMSPAPGEAFLGAVVARAPAGADAATLTIDGRPAATTTVRRGRARLRASAPPGRHGLRVTFTRRGRPVGSASAAGAWLLPASARAARPGSRTDPALLASLRAAVRGAPAYRAAWVQDLTTGATAGVADDAAFPAASMVKLGLMVGALARLGPSPERSPYAHDLRAVAGWSSNLAANRLLRRLGGTAVAADGLRRLGARASTYPGEYIAGTELQPSLPPPADGASPPRVSSRVTTARDLGRMLYALHAAAVGAPGARRQTGLTAHAARQALGWLLSSQQRGDNRSLVAGGLPPGAPTAQKNGWIRSARHAAAIAYTADGPVIAVLLTYDAAGVTARAGRALGSRVAAVAASS